MIEIIQLSSTGEFQLKCGPRHTRLTYEQATWIAEDWLEEFDLDKAKEYYSIKRR